MCYLNSLAWDSTWIDSTWIYSSSVFHKSPPAFHMRQRMPALSLCHHDFQVRDDERKLGGVASRLFLWVGVYVCGVQSFFVPPFYIQLFHKATCLADSIMAAPGTPPYGEATACIDSSAPSRSNLATRLLFKMPPNHLASWIKSSLIP